MSKQRAMNKVIGDVQSTLVSGIRFVNPKIENVCVEFELLGPQECDRYAI